MALCSALALAGPCTGPQTSAPISGHCAARTDGFTRIVACHAACSSCGALRAARGCTAHDARPLPWGGQAPNYCTRLKLRTGWMCTIPMHAAGSPGKCLPSRAESGSQELRGIVPKGAPFRRLSAVHIVANTTGVAVAYCSIGSLTWQTKSTCRVWRSSAASATQVRLRAMLLPGRLADRSAAANACWFLVCLFFFCWCRRWPPTVHHYASGRLYARARAGWERRCPLARLRASDWKAFGQCIRPVDKFTFDQGKEPWSGAPALRRACHRYH